MVRPTTWYFNWIDWIPVIVFRVFSSVDANQSKDLHELKSTNVHLYNYGLGNDAVAWLHGNGSHLQFQTSAIMNKRTLTTKVLAKHKTLKFLVSI